jgi:ribosome-associated protein
MESKDLAYELARIIDDKKGYDITIIDLRGIADVAEFFVIATGANNRQVDAIVDEIENVLRDKGIRAFAIEGREDNSWDLMDFGGVMVHVFQPEARAFYRLERLWGDAPRVDYVEGDVLEVEPGESDRQSSDSENAEQDAFDAAHLLATENLLAE